MRIELDDEVCTVLDKIKQDNFHIGGKGHNETVKFLAYFYLDRKHLEKNIEEAVKQAITELLAKLVRNGEQ